MTITLYYYELWPESMAARVLYEEHPQLAQTPFVLKRVDMAAKEHRKPPFLALNPQGEPPVLVDDVGLSGHEYRVWDVIGVAAYLHQLDATPLFIPPICNMPVGFQWAAWSHTQLVEPVQALVAEWKLSGPNGADAGQVARLVKRLERSVGILEGALPKSGGFANWDFNHAPPDNGVFGIADVMIGSALTYTHRIATTTFDLGQFPTTAAYLAALEARPSFQSVFKGVTLGTPIPPKDMP